MNMKKIPVRMKSTGRECRRLSRLGTSALSGTPRYPDGVNNDDDEHDECGPDSYHQEKK